MSFNLITQIKIFSIKIKVIMEMTIEKTKNRDLLLKVAFMYFLSYILIILGIDEEIVELKPIEYVTMKKTNGLKIFNKFLDHCALTRSGKVILFEFKKDPIRKKDLKQACQYSRIVYCKEKKDVITIIITISKMGKMAKYTYQDNTFHPRIIKTKTINKQKDLKIIRDKFKTNKMLTLMDCALMITLPLFDLKESEAEIVREMCEMIKDHKPLIPEDETERMTMGMYLNIIEYLNEDEHEKYEEMIDLTTVQKGVIATIEENGRKKGKREGKIEGIQGIINNLLNKYSLDETAYRLDMSREEIREILNG